MRLFENGVYFYKHPKNRVLFEGVLYKEGHYSKIYGTNRVSAHLYRPGALSMTYIDDYQYDFNFRGKTKEETAELLFNSFDKYLHIYGQEGKPLIEIARMLIETGLT